MDNQIEFNPDVREFAMRIYGANIAMIRSAVRGTAANMSPFRGKDMDQGTAFEIGFTHGLGRMVSGYSNVPASLPSTLPGQTVRASGFEIRPTFAAAIIDLALGDGAHDLDRLDTWFCRNVLAY